MPVAEVFGRQRLVRAAAVRAWRLTRAFAVLTTAACLLTACATRAPVGPADLSGRLAVRVDGQPERSVSASFELHGTPRQGRLVLIGPLGSIAAQAEWNGKEAWLLANGERSSFASLDELATAALGEPIPIAALFDWLRGQAWPAAPHTPRADGVPGFDQLGWRIDLSRWADAALEASRLSPPVVTVRARLERP